MFFIIIICKCSYTWYLPFFRYVFQLVEIIRCIFYDVVVGFQCVFCVFKKKTIKLLFVIPVVFPVISKLLFSCAMDFYRFPSPSEYFDILIVFDVDVAVAMRRIQRIDHSLIFLFVIL